MLEDKPTAKLRYVKPEYRTYPYLKSLVSDSK